MSDIKNVNYNEFLLCEKCKNIMALKSLSLTIPNINDDIIVFCELANTAILKFKQSLAKHIDYINAINSVIMQENADSLSIFLDNNNNNNRSIEINNNFTSCEKLFNIAEKYYENSEINKIVSQNTKIKKEK